ncbi:MAG TPA: hypothetical protein DHU63_08485 [Candidatus Marinimicrobia bacterium]|nr:hypothetical protein [Candidatus Neomarinimicrobiota bacterium]
MLILLIYVLDFGYYDYLATRMDASMVAFARNPITSLRMAWESYPLFVATVLFTAIGYGSWRLLSWIVRPVIREKQPSWLTRILLGILTFIIIVGLGYGKWSRYPLRWSDAFFSTYEPANQMAMNPVLFFVNTFTRRNEKYDLNTVKKYYPVVANWLGIPDSSQTPLNYTRHIEPRQKTDRKYNVIVVFLETFPTYKVGVYGNPMQVSPNFDRLSQQGLHFTNYYVPKVSTAASIFSAMTGIPDISVIDRSSTRDPYAINQHLLMNDLTGYKKHFFIGGSANWGDVGGFFHNNVAGIKIHQEGDFAVPETNAWGISDDNLMIAANDILKNEQQPFFTVILTAGHHRPYTLPEHTPGFEYKKYPQDEQLIGFNGEDELNAFRYMDFSIGHLVDMAKRDGYFDNTIFVFFGDHGISNVLKPMPYGTSSLHLFHVPLLIYGPGVGIKPQQIDRIVSEIDLMPTIMGLLGEAYDNTTLGRDMFSPAQAAFPSAYMFDANTTSYGLLYEPFFLLRRSDGVEKLYQPWAPDSVRDWKSEYPDDFQKLETLAKGINATAQYLRYNNKR